MTALQQNIEDIHPALWRGTQLARSYGRTVDTGYPALSAELPGGGWPAGALIELLVSQSGVGEIRLLRPALISVSKRPIALLAPPQTPNALGWRYLGLPPDKLLLLNARKTADALWSAEQILKSGSCGALLFWQQHIRGESLRRLVLAAQTSETLFVLLRPLAAAMDSSPATLRLAVRPTDNGVSVDVIKRKGPIRKERVVIAVSPSPILLSPYERRQNQRPIMPIVERGGAKATT